MRAALWDHCSYASTLIYMLLLLSGESGEGKAVWSPGPWTAILSDPASQSSGGSGGKQNAACWPPVLLDPNLREEGQEYAFFQKST